MTLWAGYLRYDHKLELLRGKIDEQAAAAQGEMRRQQLELERRDDLIDHLSADMQSMQETVKAMQQTQSEQQQMSMLGGQKQETSETFADYDALNSNPPPQPASQPWQPPRTPPSPKNQFDLRAMRLACLACQTVTLAHLLA